MKKVFKAMDEALVFFDEELLYRAVEDPEWFTGRSVEMIVRMLYVLDLHKSLSDYISKYDDKRTSTEIMYMSLACYYLWLATTDIKEAVHEAKKEAFNAQRAVQTLLYGGNNAR